MTTPMLPRWAQRIFPHAGIPNIRAGYIMTAADSAAFISGNWIFFWLLFLSYSELGITDSLAFAFGLFMEIPTGALGDLLGKRWTVRGALLCNGIAYLIMGSAPNAATLIIGFLLYQVGLALYSGAAEALQYDTLKEHGLESEWDRVASAQNSIGLIALMLAILLGAPLYHIDPRLPHWGWGIAFLLAFFASRNITEPQTGERQTFSLRAYYGQLMTGIHQLARPALRAFVLLMFGLPGVFFIYSWGVVQPAVAVNFGFGPDAQAVIGSAAYVLIAVAVRFIPYTRRRFGDMRGLTLLNIGLAVALIGMAAPLGTWGITVLLLMHLCGSTARVWMGIIVNERTDGAIRSTTLSTVALLTKLPYVLVAIVAGAMIDGGQLGVFVTGMAAASLVLLGLSLWMGRRGPARRAVGA